MYIRKFLLLISVNSLFLFQILGDNNDEVNFENCFRNDVCTSVSIQEITMHIPGL